MTPVEKLRERIQRYRKDPKEIPPKLREQMHRIAWHHLVSMLGTKCLEWVVEKPGRRFVLENNVDGEEGIAFYFEENGEVVTPDFMERAGG